MKTSLLTHCRVCSSRPAGTTSVVDHTRPHRRQLSFQARSRRAGFATDPNPGLWRSTAPGGRGRLRSPSALQERHRSGRPTANTVAARVGDAGRGARRCSARRGRQPPASQGAHCPFRTKAATGSATKTWPESVKTSSRRPAAWPALGAFRSACVTSHAGDTRRRCWSGRSSTATSSDATRRPPSWASRSTTWRVLALIQLTLADASDELGNYIEAEPAFCSSRLRKSCSVTPSFACIEPRCVRSEHADAARTAGPAASPLDDRGKRRERLSNSHGIAEVTGVSRSIRPAARSRRLLQSGWSIAGWLPGVLDSHIAHKKEEAECRGLPSEGVE
jgi:hypothetical protein